MCYASCAFFRLLSFSPNHLLCLLRLFVYPVKPFLSFHRGGYPAFQQPLIRVNLRLPCLPYLSRETFFDFV